MPPLSVLLKPASDACTLACSYCFYRDEAECREQGFRGFFSREDAEILIEKAFAYAEGSCFFLFQGGEPTLAGLDFFRHFIAVEKRLKKPGVKIGNAIQTNGMCLDEEWARFFRENRFLVGLSLDGNAALHDAARVDRAGSGTFSRAMNAARLLEREGVDFNILSVVTERSARSGMKLYSFFRKQGFAYLQFIPCLAPLNADEKSVYRPSVKSYGDFLITVFRLWLSDLRNGEYISVRHIDNLIGVLLGNEPELCSARGVCSVQCVVEGDGSVYPCDFYCLDEYCLGNIRENDFSDFFSSEVSSGFVNASCAVPAECRQCRLFPVCRNGCRRERLPGENGEIGKNEYCEAYRRFFSECEGEIREALQLVRRMQRGNS